MIWSSAVQRILGRAFALVCLGVMIWAAIVLWQRPCRYTGEAFVHGGYKCPSVAEDMAPLAIALGLWTIGLLVEHRGPQGASTAFLLGAAVLASGGLSTTDSDIGNRLFYVVLAWSSPVIYRVHRRLLLQQPGHLAELAVRGFCALAVVLWLPPVLWAFEALRQREWYSLWRGAVRLTVALSIFLSVLLLVLRSRRDLHEPHRRPVRLIAFGSISAFMPFVLLSLLPETLGARIFVPYEMSFFGLLINAVFYAYALMPDRLGGIAITLKRFSVYYLLLTLLSCALLVGATLLPLLSIDAQQESPVIGVLVAAGLLLVLQPVRDFLVHLTDWVWFGRRASYYDVLGRLVDSLAVTLDRDRLEMLLVDDLARAMRLTGSALFLRDQHGGLTLARSVGLDAVESANVALPRDGPLAAHLLAQGEPIYRERLQIAVADADLGEAERGLLSVVVIALWLPLVSGGELNGVLLLGPKTGEDFFTPEDQRILTTLAHQSGVAAHNAQLVGEVQDGQRELSIAHQQLLVASEQERRRLARELHDGALQRLVGMTYQLHDSREDIREDADLDVQVLEPVLLSLQSLGQGLLDAIAEIRALISDLRPAGLEELGLAAALDGYVTRLKREHGAGAPAIELNLDDGGVSLRPEIALCLFRVAQEALRNALRHANASHIELSLHVRTDHAELTMRDDGCGFVVPDRLSMLAAEDHFGLMGLAERVAHVSGVMTIHSEPGAGTVIRVQLATDEEAQNDDSDHQGSAG